jgi:hypothetical protein
MNWAWKYKLELSDIRKLLDENTLTVTQAAKEISNRIKNFLIILRTKLYNVLVMILSI